ncbi:MAG TPA: hypothetical protein VJ911_03110 [Cryomorphaceae bacterium]|nr:hypothetical protein [Cryomorphaceae bacterium]
MKSLTAILILLAALGTSSYSHAQCDTTAHYAANYLGSSFVSDGQSYRALIYDDQIAEFTTTLYGDQTYRIVAFSGMEKEQLIFSVYDQNDRELFSNENYQNSPYWDFEIESTIDCRIEAKLDPVKQKSGCAVLLIGFER